MTPTKSFLVRLAVPTHKAVKKLARSELKPASVLIREAIDKYIMERPDAKQDAA